MEKEKYIYKENKFMKVNWLMDSGMVEEFNFITNINYMETFTMIKNLDHFL